MKALLWFLVVTLFAFSVGGCGPSPSPIAEPATPIQASTPAPTQAPASTGVVETAEPTPTMTAETTSVPALPALVGHLHWLGHASFRLDGPPTIYFDPTTSKDEWPRADIVLISHGHDDHYSPQTVKRLSTSETVVIANPDVAARLGGGDGLAGELRVMRPGERTAIDGVEIEAVPAYNIDKSYHPREAEHLGFIVTVGGERIYFAGDTDRIPEMADFRCDVALLPIGGTYTMDADEAALAAADIGPKVVIPMHVRSADPEQFRSLCDCEVVIMEVEQ